MTAERVALAEHWLDAGRPERALQELDTAGEASFEVAGWQVRSRALRELGDPPAAALAARRGLARDPDDLLLLAGLSDALRDQDDLQGAEAALLHALRVAPQAPWLLTAYARLLATAGESAKAEQVLERAASLRPDDLDVLRTRAYLAFACGDDGRARRLAREALGHDPQDLGSHRLFGAASAVSGRSRDAERHLAVVAAASLGDRDARAAAVEARIAAHPALLPLRVISRWSPGVVWLFGIALVFGATRLLPPGPAGVVVFSWLAFIVWSWVGPPVVGRWVRWRGGW